MNLTLALTAVAFAIAADPQPDLMPREGLMLPPVARGGRASLGTDPIEQQRIHGTWKRPSAGDAIKLSDGSERKWEPVKGKGDGSFPVAPGGYAYFRVASDTNRVVILEATGHGSAIINGVPRTGDVYSSRYVRLPIPLHQGDNDLLLQHGRGALVVKLSIPKGDKYLDTADTTMPDLIVNRTDHGPGSLLVVNATDQIQTNLQLSASLAGGRPALAPVPVLLPHSVAKIGFPIQGSVAAGDKEASVAVRLLQGDTVLDTATIKAAIKQPGELQKRTFRSGIDGSVQYFGLVPANPKAGDPTPGLIVTLHGAAVEGIGQAACFGPRPWAHVVAPTNRRPFGFDWEDWGRLDALEVIDEASRVLKPDPARVWLTGHSMGGHGTWHLGVTFPDRFAVIGPSAGWVSMFSYAGLRKASNPDAITELIARAATPSDTLALVNNLKPVPVYVLHGDKDDNVPVGQARTMKQALEKWHPDFHYHEQPGAGHWWGNNCVDWKPMMELMQKHQRPKPEAVTRVEFSTAAPIVSSRCHWLSIEAQEKPFRVSTATIDHDVSGRKFTGKTENVARLALDLGHLPPGKPVGIELDGQPVVNGAWPAEGVTVYLRKVDGKWASTGRPSPAEKGPHRAGPFKDAFRNQVLFVYGTIGTPAENAWALAKARFDAETFWYRGNGAVEVIPDSRFDNAATRDRNVIVYGHAQMNSAWKTLLGNGPVQISRGKFQVGTKTGEADDLGCLFVRPRPGSDRAMVGVVAGTGDKGLRRVDRLPYFSSGTGYPDLLLLAPSGPRAAGYFGNDWSIESGEFAWRE
jgi:dienelactone hydrolase